MQIKNWKRIHGIDPASTTPASPASTTPISLLFKKHPPPSITRISNFPPTFQTRGNQPLNQQSILCLQLLQKDWKKYLDTTTGIGEGVDPLHARHGLGADNAEDAASIVDSHCQIRHSRRELQHFAATTKCFTHSLSRLPFKEATHPSSEWSI